MTNCVPTRSTRSNKAWWRSAMRTRRRGIPATPSGASLAKGRLLGGLLGSLVWDWLQIDVLWVDAAERGRGYGRALLHSGGGGRPGVRLLARSPGHVRLRGAWLLREARVCRVRCARRLPARALADSTCASGVAVDAGQACGLGLPIADTLSPVRSGWQRWSPDAVTRHMGCRSRHCATTRN